MFLKTKKIIFLISVLAVLNLIFLFDIFFINGAVAQESYCYSKDPVFYYPKSLIISESNTCDSDCNIENQGRLLFKYYGEDSDCLSVDNQSPKRQKDCYENYPFGGPGTLETGGNLAINNARGLYINGQDSAGFHWILSGTQEEPQGRAMGFRLGLEDVYFGRNIIVGDDLKLQGIIDLVDDNYIARSSRSWGSMPGLSCAMGGPASYNFNEIDFNDNLHFLEGNDLENDGGDIGVCTEWYCDGDFKQCRPTSGGTYRTILDESTVIKGNLRVEDNIYIFWDFDLMISSNQVLYYKQLVKDYYRQIEERKEEFAGHTASCAKYVSERQAYGIYYPNIADVSWCWPQPLNHYKIINYISQDAGVNGAGNSYYHPVGEIVLCPDPSNMTSGPPGSSPSCQSCENSDPSLVLWNNAKTYGCPE